MRTAARMARAGNRLLDFIVLLMVAVMFLYGTYSLWDNYQISQRAYITDELLQYKPTVESSESLLELMAENPEVIGWITVDDTHIDYPMTQGQTDMDYINKDVHGEFALSGAIFLSCISSKDFTDPYSIIYGHHMDNGAMFGDVVEFAEAEYFEEHQTGRIYLLGSTMELELFACVKTDASDSVVYNPQLQETDVSGLLTYLDENAVQYRNIDVTKEDRIVALSTCSEAVTNGRVILFGKLGDPVETDNGGVSNGHEDENI